MKPDWIAARVERPIAVPGSARSIRVIRAARSIRALSEICEPRTDRAAEVLALGGDASMLIPVPKSTTTQASAEALVGGDRVDQAIGADLERVVDADRHPGLHPRPDRQAGERRDSAWSSCSNWVPSGGTTEETQTASTSANDMPQRAKQAGDPLGQLVAGRPRAGLKAPVLDQALAVEGAEVGLGVADVDREEHGRDYHGHRRRIAPVKVRTLHDSGLASGGERRS